MGTDRFASDILLALLTWGYTIVAVVTQPDKKIGRKQEICFSDVKKTALANNLPIIQPIDIREEYQMITTLTTDLVMTCAYGQFLPDQIVSLDVINIHASLLPKYRGGAPIHRAIMMGEKKSGISLMRSTKRMDAGPVCAQKTVDIDDTDTTLSLQKKLIECTKQLLVEYLPLIFNGKAIFIEQDEDNKSFAKILRSEDELINFNSTLQDCYNQIRSLIDWPIGYCLINSRKLKFYAVRKLNETTSAKNGTVLDFAGGYLRIAVDGGVLGFNKVQIAGKQILSADDFANGMGRSLVGKIASEN